MLSITKEFRFDAAHKLWLDSLSEEENRALYGKCSAFHGHTYTLQVTVAGEVDASGMIMNFTELKRLVNELILDRYDHANLNELPEYKGLPVTAENMVLYIHKTLLAAPEFKSLTLKELRLYETPDSWATITG